MSKTCLDTRLRKIIEFFLQMVVNLVNQNSTVTPLLQDEWIFCAPTLFCIYWALESFYKTICNTCENLSCNHTVFENQAKIAFSKGKKIVINSKSLLKTKHKEIVILRNNRQNEKKSSY